jgi:hypothetical protein
MIGQSAGIVTVRDILKGVTQTLTPIALTLNHIINIDYSSLSIKVHIE